MCGETGWSAVVCVAVPWRAPRLALRGSVPRGLKAALASHGNQCLGGAHCPKPSMQSLTEAGIVPTLRSGEAEAWSHGRLASDFTVTCLLSY